MDKPEKKYAVRVTPNNNLPTRIEPFVGRERELSQIIQALLDPYIPLVTIVGLAGIGKTALALEVAHRLLEKGEFSGGIVWLDSPRANTLPALLETMEVVLSISPGDFVREGVHPSLTLREGIPAYLRTQPCLLVFDGLDAVPDDKDVVAFLDRLPSPSKALVTSRRRVGLLGQERVFELEPLGEEEAVQFLVAAAHRYGVEIAPDKAREIARIVNGLPLAIALVAAQAAVIPLDELEASLERKGLEAVTLQATFRVVYERLSDAAQRLLRRMAVFEGGADGAAISQACQVEEWQETLTELVHHSLVEAQNGRYRLHPLIRQLVLEQLEAAAERRITEERAAGYFLSLAQSAQSKLYTEEAPNVITMVNAERANLLAGMAWYQKRETWDQIMTYGLALGELFRATGDWADRLKVLEGAMDAAIKARDERQRAVILHNLGVAHQELGNYTLAHSFYEGSLTLKRFLGDKRGLATTLHQLGMLAQAQGDYQTALHSYEESLRLARELGERRGEAQTLSNLGVIYQAQGRWAEAVELYERALLVFEKLGDRHGEGQVFANLANVYQARGELDRAAELYERALLVFRELGDRPGVTQLSINLGKLVQTKGDHVAARHYYEQGLEIAEELGDKFWIATTTSQLGQLAEAEGSYVTAIRLSTRALVLFKELKSAYQITVANRLAQLHDRLGESAFQLIADEAGVEIPAEILERTPPEPTDSKAYWASLGRRHEREQSWSAGIEAYQKARAFFDPAGMTGDD